ncbi:hypothetical protein HC928_10155 [bacterium]|nr:hypothetical protein [bacterium]
MLADNPPVVADPPTPNVLREQYTAEQQAVKARIARILNAQLPTSPACCKPTRAARSQVRSYLRSSRG